MHLWDLLPTICAVVGVVAPSDRKIDGANLLPLLGLRGRRQASISKKEARGRMRLSKKNLSLGEELNDSVTDPALYAADAELRGVYVRTKPYVDEPIAPGLTIPPSQPMPLPQPRAVRHRAVVEECGGNDDAGPEALPSCTATSLVRPTPLFWALHRARGGMQYALRRGPWKLLGGYGPSAARAGGPDKGEEVVPWLRTQATIGHVELYLVTHDPAERVDLAALHPHVVVVLLAEMQRLLRETSREGAGVTGWTQRSTPCPRWNRALNFTETCCQTLSTTHDVSGATWRGGATASSSSAPRAPGAGEVGGASEPPQQWPRWRGGQQQAPGSCEPLTED